MFKGFMTGFSTYGDAHRIIVKHRLWGQVLLTGLINMAIFVGFVYVGFNYTDDIAEWIVRWLGLDSDNGGFLGFVYQLLEFVLQILVWTAIYQFYVMAYKYIVLIIISPFLSVLSEKVDFILTGRKYPLTAGIYIHDVIRGFHFSIRGFLRETFWIILFFFLGFLPVFPFISPFILFAISCYFYGFGMFDYSTERHRMSVRKSAEFMRQHKGMAIANGLVFYLFLLVPVVGLLFAPAYAAVAATIAYESIENPEIEDILLMNKRKQIHGSNTK
ncbi:MAG: EI24 domain-containing protein [Bacteroidetes bacterium]|nr:EI24 domain-containing protein [Bacteroidota bacterium]